MNRQLCKYDLKFHLAAQVNKNVNSLDTVQARFTPNVLLAQLRHALPQFYDVGFLILVSSAALTVSLIMRL